MTSVPAASILSLAITLAAFSFDVSWARDAHDGLRSCFGVTPDDARLACYDREARNLVAPRFSGRLNKTTDRFVVEAPTLMRYQSDGAIFVLYLKAADNTVVQNLHIGGGGEDSYLIDRPGTYFLDVSGSESWRIWLEPQRAEAVDQEIKDHKTN